MPTSLTTSQNAGITADGELEAQELVAETGTDQFLGDTDSEERPDRGVADDGPRLIAGDADGEGTDGRSNYG